MQPDGKIILCGSFTQVAGQTRNQIARLNPDGSLDPFFIPNSETNEIQSAIWDLALQTDGRILVAGEFTRLAGQSRNSLGRLNCDGSLDETFNGRVAGRVTDLLLDQNGQVILGGTFSSVGGQPRQNLARLCNTGPATERLEYDGTAITWTRAGTGTELRGTIFETSTNGLNWVNLGSGKRSEGGWHFGPLILEKGVRIRARGFVSTTHSSGWFVESIAGPLFISSQPQSLTNTAGAFASFRVNAGGTPPLRYQWLKEGSPLQESENVIGTATRTLTIRNLLRSDRGDYSVIVEDFSGSVTSAVAALEVVDPAITVAPLGHKARPGQDVELTASASGTAPISYQWRKNGIPLAGETAASLKLLNLRLSDAAGYDLVVTNSFGAATSSVVLLTINGVEPDSFTPWPDGRSDWVAVDAMAVRQDGKIVVGGTLHYWITGAPRAGLAQLDPDGALDIDFRKTVCGAVHSLAAQADGELIVGGRFCQFDEEGPHNVERLAGALTHRSTLIPSQL